MQILIRTAPLTAQSVTVILRCIINYCNAANFTLLIFIPGCQIGNGSTICGFMEPRVTPREKEVLTLMCEGKSAQEIAIILGCSAYTVRTHIGRLKDEFNVYKDTALIAAAFRKRIIE